MKRKLVVSLLMVTALIMTVLITAAACSQQPTAPSQPPTSSTPSPPTTPEQPAKTIELTYSNFFPPTHLNSVLAQQWIEEISTRTNGQVEFTYLPGGTLTPADKTYDGVVSGIADIGMSCFAYTMGRFPASTMVDYPHGYPSGWVATMVANDFYQKFKPAELDDVHLLYLHAHGPGVIFTTKKPVNKLEDLKGMIIRATGIGAKIMEGLGAKGYGAAQGEAYELLAKGVVDGSFAPREVLKGWKQAEVVKYVTGCYDVGNTTNMFVVMNTDKWNSLPDNVKKVFTDVSAEWIDKHGKVWNYYDKAGQDYFVGMSGKEYIELPAQEVNRWVEAAQPVINNYIEEISSKGLAGAEYEEYLLKQVEYWSTKAPSADESYSWVEQNVLPLVPEN